MSKNILVTSGGRTDAGKDVLVVQLKEAIAKRTGAEVRHVAIEDKNAGQAVDIRVSPSDDIGPVLEHLLAREGSTIVNVGGDSNYDRFMAALGQFDGAEQLFDRVIVLITPQHKEAPILDTIRELNVRGIEFGKMKVVFNRLDRDAVAKAIAGGDAAIQALVEKTFPLVTGAAKDLGFGLVLPPIAEVQIVADLTALEKATGQAITLRSLVEADDHTMPVAGETAEQKNQRIQQAKLQMLARRVYATQVRPVLEAVVA